jgi:hypothetical protein
MKIVEGVEQGEIRMGWEDFKVEKFFEALLKVIEEKEGVKITGTVRKKTPEEMEKYPDRWIIFSDELKEKYGLKS